MSGAATDPEPILRSEHRDISILVADEQITITRAAYAAGQEVAGPHIHREHTDAFYVLEGELIFEVGCERWDVAPVPAGGGLPAGEAVVTQPQT